MIHMRLIIDTDQLPYLTAVRRLQRAYGLAQPQPPGTPGCYRRYAGKAVLEQPFVPPVWPSSDDAEAS